MCEHQKSPEFGSAARCLDSKHRGRRQQQDQQVRGFSHLTYVLFRPPDLRGPARWDTAGRDPFPSIHSHPRGHSSPSSLRLGADRLPITAEMRMQLAEITPGALQMFHLLCPGLTFCSRWVTGTRLRTPPPPPTAAKKKRTPPPHNQRPSNPAMAPAPRASLLRPPPSPTVSTTRRWHLTPTGLHL